MNQTNEENNVAPENNEQDSKKRKLKLILIFIIVFVLVFCIAYFGLQYYYNSQDNTTVPTKSTTASSTTSATLVDNPIDFEALKEGNSEIYAWITIDDTNVDYPVVQSEQDDSFYLKHSAIDKSWSESGAIYTEMVNNTNFNDAITVIYGHNGYGDTMFTTLHYFEKEDFFNEHPYFTIYTQGRKLTYQIMSAFKYDDRHIMNSFNFADTAVLQEFQEYLQNPDTAVKNIRENLDVDIDINSKIVILSTCITNQKSNRYLVCGVLIKDEKTN